MPEAMFGNIIECLRDIQSDRRNLQTRMTMKTKEQQAKDYAEQLPHCQDRKQHAAEDFLAGWEAAEKWRTDKENIPDGEAILAIFLASTPMLLTAKEVKHNDLFKYWKPLPKLPEE